MPKIWLYLLKNYLKILFLSLVSLIAILLVSCMEDIAEFAAMGAKFSYILLFTLYQIPYFLPLTITISCLISSWILFQNLSHSGELIALRSSGIALRRIIAPILLAGIVFSIGTFYITSEVATASHFAARKMAYEFSSVNPILLLQSAKIAQLNNAFVQLRPVRNGEAAQDLVIALNNPSAKRLNLCLIKGVEMKEGQLLANQISLISSSIAEKAFDHLIIENQKTMSSSAPAFASLLQKKGCKIANDHLKFSLLRIRCKNLHEQSLKDGTLQRSLKKCYSEFARRISCGLGCFTFTLLGVAFGIEIGRNRAKAKVFILIALAGSNLIAFFLGKELDFLVVLSYTCFLVPHFCTIAASFWILNRVNKGIG